MLNTPFGNNKASYQTSENYLNKLRCFKKTFPHIGVGFIDFKKDEFIKESFDVNLQSHGEAAPQTVVVY